MYFLLSGTAQISCSNMLGRKSKKRTNPHPLSTWTRQAEEGEVLSEGVALGSCETQPRTLRAVTPCLVQVLTRRQFNNLLTTYPTERWLFNGVNDEAKQRKNPLALQERVLRSTFFSQLGREFGAALCEGVEDTFFAPGEEIFTRGTPCEYGEGCMYVLMAGQARVDSPLGIVMGRATPGEVLGEAGAFGYALTRKATVRAWNGGLVHCAKLQGSVIKSAVQRYRVECEAIGNLFKSREQDNRRFEEHKKQWLDDTVIPTLLECAVFSVLSRAVVEEIATLSASVSNFPPGKNITSAGEPADSMLLLLEGEVDMLSQAGEVIGPACSGATFGDVILLGLLMLRTATIQAKTHCKMITISTDTFDFVLAKPASAASRAALERLRKSRLEQVSQGMPISSLPEIKASKDDVCLRTIALQTEHLHLAEGTVWTPRSDSSAAGPHFGFLVKGSASIQNPEEDRRVMALPEGCIIHEGLVAKYGAYIRAGSVCEAYRVRQVDFELAVRLSPTGCTWYLIFQMLLKESRKHMTARLQSARGAIDGTIPRKKDTEIRNWHLDRQVSLDHAGRMRQERRNGMSPLLRGTSPLLKVGNACLRGSSSATILNRYPETGQICRSASICGSRSGSPRQRDSPRRQSKADLTLSGTIPSKSPTKTRSGGHLPFLHKSATKDSLESVHELSPLSSTLPSRSPLKGRGAHLAYLHHKSATKEDLSTLDSVRLPKHL